MIAIVFFYVQMDACETKFVRLLEIYESEMQEAQVQCRWITDVYSTSDQVLEIYLSLTEK